MFRRYLLLVSILALSACQNQALVELDYQPNYNYSALQGWQWAEPSINFVPTCAEASNDLDAERVRRAIAEQLRQQGLQQSDHAALQVRAWLITEQQQQNTQAIQGGYWTGLWGPTVRIENYDVTYTTQKLQIDLLDSSTQTLIWRGSDSWILPARRISPHIRDAKIREYTQRILQHFPPQ